MLKEFKEFALKGNVLDLAVGIIIGGAFGKIVASLVNDIIIPTLSLLLGTTDFSKYSIPGTEIKYGMFIQNIADFLIISFSIFLFIKFINSFKKKKEKVEKEVIVVELTKNEMLLTEIRDLLRDKSIS